MVSTSSKGVSGAQLLAARVSARLTQVRMAHELGLYPATLVDAENDRLPIGAAGYAALLQAVEEVVDRLESL
jgi:hypothetical protein